MFESAKLKIIRANQHLRDFETRFAEYVATKPHRFSIHNDPESGQPKIRIRFESDRTKTFTLVVGDAIHNLRTALDHLTWEVIGLDGGTQNRYTKLPTGDNRVYYEAACKGIETPSDWVKSLFISLEPKPATSWAITNKHRQRVGPRHGPLANPEQLNWSRISGWTSEPSRSVRFCCALPRRQSTGSPR